MAGDIVTEEAEDGDRDREDGQTRTRKIRKEGEEEDEKEEGARERMAFEALVQGMKAPEEMEAGTGSRRAWKPGAWSSSS